VTAYGHEDDVGAVGLLDGLELRCVARIAHVVQPQAVDLQHYADWLASATRVEGWDEGYLEYAVDVDEGAHVHAEHAQPFVLQGHDELRNAYDRGVELLGYVFGLSQVIEVVVRHDHVVCAL